MLKQSEVLVRNSPFSEGGFQSLQEAVSELIFEKPPVSVASLSLPGLPPTPWVVGLGNSWGCHTTPHPSNAWGGCKS